jgi:hypothetical protein
MLSRPLYGAAASLVVFVLARLLASSVYPIGIYPFHNQILFMGTPFLALALLVPGVSSLGQGAANAINAVSWALLGGAIALLVRRPLFAAGVWLILAAVGAALVFVGVIRGMMSGSP